ncbi:NifU-like protein involved in Fe-S cluster formation [Haloferula luteola]|uniref:NifU-like protein involved in Fe-S cluster formation n=1 Tax=Haloferula luteola TaxID=595692 RepID=A0A840VJ73_9BACT|nr:NifU-like protein involved in Fe-S cluster formation [Haloferula luteola]
MSRSIQVRVSPTGDIVVEAIGFQGNGCEAATMAIEAALGKTSGRKFKPEHRQQSLVVRQIVEGGGA